MLCGSSRLSLAFWMYTSVQGHQEEGLRIARHFVERGIVRLMAWLDAPHDLQRIVERRDRLSPCPPPGASEIVTESDMGAALAEMLQLTGAELLPDSGTPAGAPRASSLQMTRRRVSNRCS